MSEQRKIRVAVVFGGRGPEHPVSCMGGGNMLGAIDRDRYEVIPIGITTEGNWVQVADAPDRLAVTGGELPTVAAVAEPGSSVVPWAGGAAGVVATAPAQIPQLFGEVDLVLPVLHGPYGEDGTIQGLLEMAGVPYVGAGVLASAVSMDKEYMNLIFTAKGLPVGPYVAVREHDWPGSTAAEIRAAAESVEAKRTVEEVAALGWPLFVKPARGGSSIGTSKAHDLTELHEAMATARQYDPKILIEAAIDGVEVEVSVLQGVDGAPPDTSMPGQLDVGGEEFYDFDTKYMESASKMLIPAPIPDSAIVEIRRLAGAAFDAVSCEGLARVDFFYTSGGQILLNEINTMPGLSPTSYFQKMWEASGLPFPQLVDRLLETALKKRPGLR
ncbi:MAG: D-alanine--D-alanine ligase family protein [Streptosporangiaceae bacterium]